MNFRRLFVASAVFFAMMVPVMAADDPLSYDDPGMHFRPPDGWERIHLEDTGPDQNGNQPPLAVYVLKKSKIDQRAISISARPFTGSLDAWENTHAADLRQQGESIFIEKQQKTTLSNGMPVYWLKVNQGTTVGRFLRRYEYVVVDLKRGITASYFGHAGDFDEKEAKEALSSLYVVVYPRNH